ncbi:hypothetical protein F2Q70_00016752 [Brassica cretica]|uniref:Putative plant transposon protein domain-containing protein n=1 Tax=Brassica cretica TaxID=69181 RepID=A0A8S9I2C2_BRACR|nr:hypothetical protein F2Q70_00016752 [Brassica cretica]
MSSESSGSNCRRNREFCSSSPHRLEPCPYMSFDSRLETTRLFFVSNAPVPNPWSLRHLDDPAVCETRRILEDIGWIYTVLHVRPFCPKVVRECISNLYSADDGVYIRGFRFDFDPVVINQLFMTPNVEHSHYDYLYKLCSLNWLPGFDDDSMIKRRLRFLFAVVRKKPIDFSRLVYDQVLEMSRSCDVDTKITLPNLIYQTLILQRDITALPGDEPLIGSPLWINGDEVDTDIRRGRRGRARLG